MRVRHDRNSPAPKQFPQGSSSVQSRDVTIDLLQNDPADSSVLTSGTNVSFAGSTVSDDSKLSKLDFFSIPFFHDDGPDLTDGTWEIDKGDSATGNTSTHEANSSSGCTVPDAPSAAKLAIPRLPSTRPLKSRSFSRNNVCMPCTQNRRNCDGKTPCATCTDNPEACIRTPKPPWIRKARPGQLRTHNTLIPCDLCETHEICGNKDPCDPCKASGLKCKKTERNRQWEQDAVTVLTSL